MTQILLNVLLALPMVYILSLYLLEEDGPFGIFWGVRSLAGFTRMEVTDITGKVELQEVDGTGFWGKVLSCHRCLSPYATAVVMVFLGLTGVSEWNALMVVKWFAVTGLNVLVFEALGR